MPPNAHFSGNAHAGFQHLKGADRCKRTGQTELLRPTAVGTGTLSQHDIPNQNVGMDGTGRADTHNVLHIKYVIQFMGVNAGRHNGNSGTFIKSGVSLNAADVVHQFGIFQKVFCNEFGAQRITGHQYRLSEVPRSCLNVRSRIICHRKNSFPFFFYYTEFFPKKKDSSRNVFLLLIETIEK